MTTDKNNPEKIEETQPTENRQAPVNPFHDAAATEIPPSGAEETNLEQQRKEAMTERD